VEDGASGPGPVMEEGAEALGNGKHTPSPTGSASLARAR
jgi:hypothetical protein